MTPKLSAIRRDGTHRLIPSRHGHQSCWSAQTSVKAPPTIGFEWARYRLNAYDRFAHIVNV